MNISIILAAGEGTRMKSKTSKVLHNICGRPILEYVIEASKGANVEKNIVIVGNDSEKVKMHFKERDIIFKDQPMGEGVPYGTGYAVMQGLDHIEDDSTVLILYGDTPLITEETINKLLSYHDSNGFEATVLTAIIDDPTGYGRIIRESGGDILKIVEQKDATEEEIRVKEVNSGIYCFNGGLLKYALGKTTNNNAQNEYYVTDVIGILKDEGYKVGAYIIDDSTEIHGVNSRLQLSFSESIMKQRINKYHMDKGVTIIDPINTYIESSVQIGRDTIIYPGTSIEGSSQIGEDCIIKNNCIIVDSKIGSSVEIESSTIKESVVGEKTIIGPYAQLRPSSIIGRNAKIGNFVEVKNSTLGDGTKASHLSYIGDADIGENVNIGCGVVFANYDGIKKHRTIIGDNVFIGSNSSLIAPLKIEDYGFVAAGSTITKDISEGTLSIGRAKQVDIEGWVEKKGLKNK